MAEVVELALVIRARELKKQIDDVQREVRQLGGQTEKTSRRMNNAFKKTENQARKLGKTIGGAIAAFAGARTLGRAINAARQLELTFSRLEGLVGVSARELALFRDEVGRLTNELGAEQQELAETLFTITSAGARGAEAISVLEQAAKAGQAGLGSFEDVARATLGAIEAYGSETLSAAEATDVLVATIREGNIPASSLASQLGRVTGTAAEAGVSFNELNAFIANASRSGLGAADVVTRLSAVLRLINKPSQRVLDDFEELGINFKDFRDSIQQDGLLVAFQNLRDELEAQGKSFRDIRLDSLAFEGILSIVGKNAKSAEAIFRALTNATGATDKAFGAFNRTADAAFNQSLANFNKALANLGDSILPTVTTAVKLATTGLDGLISAFFDFDNAFKSRTAINQTRESISELSQDIFDLREKLRRREAGNIDLFDLDNSELKAEIAEAEELLSQLQQNLIRQIRGPVKAEVDVDTGESEQNLDGVNKKGEEVDETFGNLRDSADAYLAGLEREIELFGNTTRLAEVRYEIESGALKGISDDRATDLEQRAAELDALEAAKIAVEERKEAELEAIRELRAAAAEQAREDADRQRRATAIVQESMSERDRALSMVSMRLAEIQDLSDRGLLDPAQTEAAIAKVNQDFLDLTTNTTQSVNAIDEFWTQAFRNMEQAAGDLLFDVMQGNLDDLAGNFKSTIDRMVADLLASQLLEKLATLGGAEGGAGGAGGFSGFSFATFAANIGFGENGAFAQKRQPFIVGEAGPELFIPQTAGNIVPLKTPGEINTTSGPSDDTIQTGTNQVVVNMTIQTPDVASFERSQGQLAANAAQTFNAALKRNG